VHWIQDYAAELRPVEHTVITRSGTAVSDDYLELRDRLRAQILLGARAQADYAFRSVKDGDVVEFGTVRLQVLETPGHTPEGISIVRCSTAVSGRH
jgi:glyoxylase-like metal-dependent hydrolase (beta-lactamase superfamily II)